MLTLGAVRRHCATRIGQNEIHGDLMKGSRSLVLLLFFLSGATGLIFEVIWTRQLSLTLGVSVFAASVELEESWYRRGSEENGSRQFVVADPDGYLLRFYTDLGRRPIAQPPRDE